jgi:multiple sugar transport system permease protein
LGRRDAVRIKDKDLGSYFLPLSLVFTLLYLLVVQGYPFFWSFIISLTNKQIGSPGLFIGLRNYLRLMTDKTFWLVCRFTFLFVFVTVAFKLFFGMLMGLTLNKPLPFRGLWRALLFLPWALPTLTSVLTWRWMLGDVGGVVNYFLLKLHLVGRPVAWLGDTLLAQISVIAVNIWRGIPFFGISILAALQSIPEELFEAARIDGASPWQSFWRITVPITSKVVLLVSLISTIWSFGDFSIIWIMTRGGPANHTHVLSTYSYIVTFQNLDMAQGIAISLVIVPVSLILMFFTLRTIYGAKNA